MGPGGQENRSLLPKGHGWRLGSMGMGVGGSGPGAGTTGGPHFAKSLRPIGHGSMGIGRHLLRSLLPPGHGRGSMGLGVGGSCFFLFVVAPCSVCSKSARERYACVVSICTISTA